MHELTLADLKKHFPHPELRDVQAGALSAIAESKTGVVLEVPTGEGKTAIGIAALSATAEKVGGRLFYVTPTKALLEQLDRVYPERFTVVYGRAEYPCLYYHDTGKDVNARESPCYLLKCPHRVSQETGETEEAGVVPCPYLLAKFEARMAMEKSRLVACTVAFYLTNRMLVAGWTQQEEPSCIVVDEIHQLPRIARGIFEYTLSDWHLARSAELISSLDQAQADIIIRFRKSFMGISLKRDPKTKSLFTADEITRLLEIMRELDAEGLEAKIKQAVSDGRIDPQEDRTELKLLEDLTRSIPRFISSLSYSLPTGDREPLNYVYSFYYKKDDPEFADSRRKSRYYMTIRGYYVQPLIKRVMGSNVVAYSGTIGNPDILAHETGLRLPFCSFGSSFPVGNARIFMPNNTPDLAASKRARDDLKDSLKLIAKASKRFDSSGHRSLVVVISDDERQKFIEIAGRQGLEAISYGNGITAKEAARRFVAGEGSVLVGTSANYAEGIDLPKGIAPVIFFLRPGYQRPDDPEVQFEQSRFGKSRCWALWQWRVMIEALQVRGRNIRNAEDLGVCIFVSQGFRHFLYGSLPEWLRPSYRNERPWEQCIREVEELLRK